MINKIKSTSIAFLIILLGSCGFKPINQKSQNIIYFENVSIVGESRIAYKLKNNILLISDDSSKNRYNANIKIIKQKNTKIKDKAGKIKRYNMSLNVNLELVSTNSNMKILKTFSKNADYDVSEIHSDTINNENSITQRLLEQLSEEIINFITFSMRNE